MHAQSCFLTESLGCFPHMMEVQLLGDTGPVLSTKPWLHRTLCWGPLTDTNSVGLKMYGNIPAVFPDSSASSGSLGTGTCWQQSWSLILVLSQFPGTCCA